MATKTAKKYTYKNVVCTDIIDGDTVDVEIDLGFRIWKGERLRLNRINAPEIRGKQREYGLKVKEYLTDRIEIKKIKIQTFGTGKYGRYLAEIWIDGKNLNDELVKKGLAWYQEY